MPVHIVNHPLITHKISVIRDKRLGTRDFRTIVSEITLLLTYEATRDFPLKEVEIETPVCTTRARVLPDEGRVFLIPILRAGLGMVPGMLDIFPLGKVAHIGLRRNERTALPETYYYNLPEGIEGATAIIVDPMLATAGSLSAAISLVKKNRPRVIRAICLIAAPEGRERIERDHPDVDVYVAAMDERLDERKYIVPGLGDAGDRMFGT
ncbi:MAG: uracil phosphoribosyltransferase [Candidatus Sumerlaeia bacterium]|nr:uracil phosphoribosyltransferase [Candidatus Sumerlaeia bacterium]